MAAEFNFHYEAINWSNLNEETLSIYDVIILLDARPENPEERAALEKYMNNAGAWMGFYFAAFAFQLSAIPNNWDWYQNDFLGCGQYGSNTWRPTPNIENRK